MKIQNMNATSKRIWTQNTLFPSAAWEVTSQGGSIAANGAQKKPSLYPHTNVTWVMSCLSFEVKSSDLRGTSSQESGIQTSTFDIERQKILTKSVEKPEKPGWYNTVV